jgi:catechol-2,3-dioxygenase
VQLYVNDPDGNFLELFTRRPNDALPAIERAAVAERG